MGLFKAALMFAAGVYVGVYLDQNYKVPRVDEPQDLMKKLNEWLEKNKKE